MHSRRPRARNRVGLLVALVICCAAPLAQATGALQAALAGAEVALRPHGVPPNPAAAAAVERPSLQLGAGLPVGEGLVGYVAFYEPRDPRGAGAAISGILGVTQSKRVGGIEAGTGRQLYHTSTTYTYELAKDWHYGAFGLGLNLQQHEDQVRRLTGRAWRVDLGWRYEVSPRVCMGLLVQSALGGSTVWSDGTSTPGATAWQVGMVLEPLDGLRVAMDTSEFRDLRPGAWALGLDWVATPTINIRTGYGTFGGREQVTLGAGVHWGAWQIDISSSLGASPKGTLGAAVHF